MLVIFVTNFYGKVNIDWHNSDDDERTTPRIRDDDSPVLVR